MSSGSTSQSSNNAAAEQVRLQVRQAFDQLRDLSRQEIPLEQFCQALLQRVIPLTGAHGAIVWQFDPGAGFRVFQADGRRTDEFGEASERHRDLLIDVARTRQPMAIPSGAVGLEQGQPYEYGAADLLLLIVPVLDRKQQIWGMLELLQRVNVGESARDGYLRFLEQLATLFSRWQEQHDLRQLSSHQDRWSQRMDLTREVHNSRGLSQTAYAIANETRRLLAADRVSVLSWSGNHTRMQAISSQDRFDNRSNVVKMLTRIADSVVRTDEPLWITGDTSQLSPSLAARVNEFLEESHSRTLAVLPLRKDMTTDQPASALTLERRPSVQRSQPCGAIVIEFFDRERMRAEVEDDLRLSTQHAAIGLSRSIDEDAVFLMPLWRTLGETRRYLLGDARKKTITAAVALLAVALFLCFWPLTLRMRVDGLLQPQTRRNLFTEVDGVVAKIHFDHNETVPAGAVVAELDSQQLRLAKLELEGQIRTLEQQVLNLSRQLNQQNDLPEADRFEMNANLEQMQIQKEGFREQLEIVNRQMESLEIVSPVAGTVVTWDARRRLEKLPVAANQPLMTIADMDGPWRVELTIPQNRVGYINQALENNNGKPLKTEMIVATNPNRRIPGTLVSVAERAEQGADGQTMFRGIVDLDEALLEKPQPGTGVTVRVACGRRAAGFVWFYQVIDFLRTRVFF